MVHSAIKANDHSALYKAVKLFQEASKRFTYASIPTVAACQGMALGGGCEFVMQSQQRVVANESYIGLVEVGVGLIPAAGGCVTMLKRSMQSADREEYLFEVYRNFDPRAQVIRQCCHDVLNELKIVNHPLFEISLELERIALEDEYFIEKKLYPNVDFYSGIILQAVGIPVNMFTVIFALSRTVGWISQWKEMIGAPDLTIGRPRQLYHGDAKRNYTPMSER